MGRDVAGLRIDKKPSIVNAKSNGTVHPTVHVAPRVASDKGETKDYALEDNAVKSKLPEEHNENLDVLGIKSTNHEPNEKVIRAEVQKSNDKKLTSPMKLESGSAASETVSVDASSTEQPTPEKQSSTVEHVNGVETNDSGSKCSPKSNELSPKTVIEQPTSPMMSRKQLHPNDKLYYDEEDNWSLASSTATSRTMRSKVTVGVAPRFTCVDRLQRRKEFYTKLEEKHKALEKEKLEYEARTKEEEQAAIRQMRKSMVVKAKPVPSFYQEGPPPKTELKKLPVTRAKSPNLSRRKSDAAIKSTPEDKGSSGRTFRHSVGVYKETKNSPITSKSTPKSKERVGPRKSIGTNKAKETNKAKDHVKEPAEKVIETTENAQVVKEQAGTDITIEF